jgi:cell division FtsZ-interacting protein ZapD
MTTDHEKELTQDQTAEMFAYLRKMVNVPAGTPRPPLPDFIIPAAEPQEQEQQWYEKKAASPRPLTKEEELEQWGPEEDRMTFTDDLER